MALGGALWALGRPLTGKMVKVDEDVKVVKVDEDVKVVESTPREGRSRRRRDEKAPWALNDGSGEGGGVEKGRRRGGEKRAMYV